MAFEENYFNEIRCLKKHANRLPCNTTEYDEPFVSDEMISNFKITF